MTIEWLRSKSSVAKLIAITAALGVFTQILEQTIDYSPGSEMMTCR